MTDESRRLVREMRGGTTTAPVRRITGKRLWEDLTVEDRLDVAGRCLRDAKRAREEGDERGFLDNLQDAEGLIAEAREES